MSVTLVRMCLLAVLCLLPPLAWTEEVWVPNGEKWQYMQADEKLRWISGSFGIVQAKGMVIEYNPLFYLVALNWYYENPANADITLGNAISDIGLLMGDFSFAEARAKP